MVFDEDNIPEFGSIQKSVYDENTYYLLNNDIPKLNTLLTARALQPYLTENQKFSIMTGATAIVLDSETPIVYTYHFQTDRWYEMNICNNQNIFRIMWERYRNQHNGVPVLGVCVDYENNTFTRLNNAQYLSKGIDFNRFRCFGGRKRCNVADDGTILCYYGDAGYKDDGTNGQVMVYQPSFFYKVEPLKTVAKTTQNDATNTGIHLYKANYYISDYEAEGFKRHPAFYDESGNPINYILFSAYEGSMYDVSAEAYVNDGTDTDTTIETGDLLCSVGGVKPISGLYKPLNKENLEIMAQNRGAGWHLDTIKSVSANQLLMLIELGQANTQNEIEKGIVSVTDNASYNCSALTGSTAQVGNATGYASETVIEINATQTAASTEGQRAISYRGMENLWGNIEKQINGINIWGNGTLAGGEIYIASDFSFNESANSNNYTATTLTLPNDVGYTKAVGYSTEFDWLMMPSKNGGDSTQPVGDHIYVTSNLNGFKRGAFGGNWRSGVAAGCFSWNLRNNAGSYNRSTGGRLLYVPQSSATL